jgi:asparagine N-glycosylation enzyme membrane subunit Stt3
MRKKGFSLSPRLVIGIVVGLFVGIALFLRIVLPYHDIFVGDWIKFAGGDNYFYMRLVDFMTHNFPHLPAVDAYLAYPNGESI